MSCPDVVHSIHAKFDNPDDRETAVVLVVCHACNDLNFRIHNFRERRCPMTNECRRCGHPCDTCYHTGVFRDKCGYFWPVMMWTCWCCEFKFNTEGEKTCRKCSYASVKGGCLVRRTWSIHRSCVPPPLQVRVAMLVAKLGEEWYGVYRPE